MVRTGPLPETLELLELVGWEWSIAGSSIWRTRLLTCGNVRRTSCSWSVVTNRRPRAIPLVAGCRRDPRMDLLMTRSLLLVPLAAAALALGACSVRTVPQQAIMELNGGVL